jgi:hypothetical protein
MSEMIASTNRSAKAAIDRAKGTGTSVHRAWIAAQRAVAISASEPLKVPSSSM